MPQVFRMATLETYWSANTYEKRWISQRDGHERDRGRVEQGRQQDRQQDDRRDDTLFEHAGLQATFLSAAGASWAEVRP